MYLPAVVSGCFIFNISLAGAAAADGPEAARLSRKKGFAKIPIIAMTAQAMKGDGGKCLQAGMNDYIAKPIKRAGVFAMAKKWTQNRRQHYEISSLRHTE